MKLLSKPWIPECLPSSPPPSSFIHSATVYWVLTCARFGFCVRDVQWTRWAWLQWSLVAQSWPQPSSVSITWELGRNWAAQVPLQTDLISFNKIIKWCLFFIEEQVPIQWAIIILIIILKNAHCGASWVDRAGVCVRMGGPWGRLQKEETVSAEIRDGSMNQQRLGGCVSCQVPCVLTRCGQWWWSLWLEPRAQQEAEQRAAVTFWRTLDPKKRSLNFP